MRRPSRALLAMLLAASAAASAADDLGVLFHSPEERARRDRLRRGEPTETLAGPVTAKAPVTGYVRRSDGRSTVWLNGVPIAVAGGRGEVLLDPRAVRAPDNVKVERGKEAQVKR